MTVKEFSEIYNIGLNSAYEVVHREGFPAIFVGKKILIISDKVDEWFMSNKGSTI